MKPTMAYKLLRGHWCCYRCGRTYEKSGDIQAPVIVRDTFTCLLCKRAIGNEETK